MFRRSSSLLLATILAAPAQEVPSADGKPLARLLLRGATVQTMVPGEAPRVTNVLIEEGRVRALTDDVPPGADLRVIDLSGKHLLPGLIDACVNFDPEHDALYLAAGVTLVRDLGGDHAALAR
jgi:predicted amidohydrolase